MSKNLSIIDNINYDDSEGQTTATTTHIWRYVEYQTEEELFLQKIDMCIIFNITVPPSLDILCGGLARRNLT